jgi:DNA polymerase-1
LIDILQADQADESGWKPSEPQPIPDGINELALDTETDGLDWAGKSRIIGLSYRLPNGFSQYLPFRHLSGGNLGEEQVLEWARRELRGKRIFFANASFDHHMFRREGINLDEARGNSFGDIQHYAALLDDSRRKFNLDQLAMDFLNERKVGTDLDGKRMADYHASVLEPRAIADADQTWRIAQIQLQKLTEEELNDVRDLEDRLIPIVVDMEENGAPLDTETLSKWVKETEYRRNLCIGKINKEFNLRFNPNSAANWEKLFAVRHQPVIHYTANGNPSFTDDVLERVNDPWIQLARYADHLDSLRSKFIDNYDNRVETSGILRYSLHQLRSDEGGTISGRFSSSKVNIQQVMTLRNHRKRFEIIYKLQEWFPDWTEIQSWSADDFEVRRLFVPEEGEWLSADQAQVEYRIFAHYANSPEIIAQYLKDPHTDFHNFVMQMVRRVKPEIDRKATKDINFAFIFGAGTGKIATMLGKGFEEAKELVRAYKKEFPEADELLSTASRLASRRGYVKTIMGRRGRFPDRQNLHKALNKVIQGSAAETAKKKLIRIYENRKETGFVMRFPVHDEINGDSPDAKCTEMVKELLAIQEIQFRVPILWEVGTGSNWAEAK